MDGGRISYDLRFRALYPPQFHFPSGRLLINLEAQKSLRVKYHLSTRGVFYGARMLSNQLGSEFADSDYDRLNKVYSIWICMNAPKRIGNAMAIYRLTKQERVGHVPEECRHYDKLTIVQIFLDSREEYGPPGSLHRLLNVLFSPQLDYQEKERILSREYALEMTEPLRKELEQMGNIGEAILEMGLREGRKQGKKQGRELGIRQGKAQGMKQGALQTLSSLVAEGLLTPEKAAEHLGISVEEFFRKTRHLSGLH